MPWPGSATDRLVLAGHLGGLAAAPSPVEATSDLAVVTAGPSRPDLPVRRDATRASLAAAVEAVRPANVKRAVTELRDNMLAKSTRGPYESRLRTWNRLAFEGKVPAWPISTRTLEVIGAAFRAGAYRSAKEYFLAAFRYQEHDLGIEVDPLLRRFANRVIKAIIRGLPGSRLKEAFPLPALAPLVNFADRAAFGPARAAHSADVFVIAVWFMLREIEVAAARVSDMVVSPGLVVLDLPLHKTATGGERTLTRLWGGHAPSVPGPRGYAPSGAPWGGWLAVLGGAAVPGQGRRHPVQRGLGVPAPRGAERYTQSAPLALAPSAPSHALAEGASPGAPGGGSQLAVPLALADATPGEGQPNEGPGHSWLPRLHAKNPRRRTGVHRPGSPRYSSSRRFARSGRSQRRTGGQDAAEPDPCPSAFLLLPFRARLWTSPAPPMARHIAENFTTVPWAPVRPSPSRTSGPSGMSSAPATGCPTMRRACCAWSAGTRSSSLRRAADEREFFARCTWLQGFSSPGGQRWVVCPRALRVNDRRALLAMGRQARVHLDWLAEDTPGRAYAHDPLLGAAVAARQVGPLGRAHAPNRRQRRRPDVRLHPRRGHPGVRAASSGSRVAGRPDAQLCARDYYLARLGPWARVVHSPRREGEEDTVSKSGDALGQGSARRAGRATVAVVPRMLGRQVHQQGRPRERPDP